jgi:hypothetical protein
MAGVVIFDIKAPQKLFGLRNLSGSGPFVSAFSQHTAPRSFGGVPREGQHKLRIDSDIADIHNQGYQGEQKREYHDTAQYRGIISVVNCGHSILSDAGDSENRLDDQGPAQLIPMVMPTR